MFIKNKMILTTFQCVLLYISASILFSFASAQDFSPTTGLWVIDEENDGAPGRGFTLEVQNDVLVLTFYGYVGNGGQKWWLAAGALQPGSNEASMDLEEYEGGISFGGPPGSAAFSGSVGTMTIRFFSNESGEICLPNEQCKSISTLKYGWGDSAEELLGTWIITSQEYGNPVMFGFQVTFTEIQNSFDPGVVDRAIGDLIFTFEEEAFQGEIVCEKLLNNEQDYFCTIERFDTLTDLTFNISRNAIVGEYYDELGVVEEGVIFGFRIIGESGRFLIPN